MDNNSDFYFDETKKLKYKLINNNYKIYENCELYNLSGKKYKSINYTDENNNKKIYKNLNRFAFEMFNNIKLSPRQILLCNKLDTEELNVKHLYIKQLNNNKEQVNDVNENEETNKILDDINIEDQDDNNIEDQDDNNIEDQDDINYFINLKDITIYYIKINFDLEKDLNDEIFYDSGNNLKYKIIYDKYRFYENGLYTTNENNLLKINYNLLKINYNTRIILLYQIFNKCYLKENEILKLKDINKELHFTNLLVLTKKEQNLENIIYEKETNLNYIIIYEKYKLYETGKLINLDNNSEISQINLKKENMKGYLYLVKHRLVYEYFFNIKLNTKIYIINIDNNKNNLHYTNLHKLSGMDILNKKKIISKSNKTNDDIISNLDRSKEWKPIKGFNDMYLISNYGDVFSKHINKLLTPKINIDPLCYKYVIYKLTKDGINKSYHAHRLVYDTFIGIKNNDNDIDHIDRDPSNNYIGNLDEKTHKENCNNRTKRDQVYRKIIQYDQNMNFIKKWDNYLDLLKEFGDIAISNIRNACNKHKLAKGFYWRYEDKLDIDLDIYYEIKPYNGYTYSNYKINKNGDIINSKFNKPKKPTFRQGYYTIQLVSDQGVENNLRINILVANTFLDKEEHHTMVNHIDENKLNNNVDNLEWCTAKENAEYSCGIKIYKIDILTKKILDKYNSLSDAKEKNNLKSIKCISECLKNGKNYAYGFYWIKVDDYELYKDTIYSGIIEDNGGIIEDNGGIIEDNINIIKYKKEYNLSAIINKNNELGEKKTYEEINIILQTKLIENNIIIDNDTLKNKKICKLKLSSLKILEIFDSIYDIIDKLNIINKLEFAVKILNICNGINKKTLNYKWKFYEKGDEDKININKEDIIDPTKKIMQVCKYSNKIIEIFENINTIKQKLKLKNCKNIELVLLNTKTTAHNYIWEYYNPDINYSNRLYNIDIDVNNKPICKLNNKTLKLVKKYNNIDDALTDLNIENNINNKDFIIKKCGFKISAFNFFWAFYDENKNYEKSISKKKINQIDPESYKIIKTFDSIRSVLLFLNLGIKQDFYIRNACLNNICFKDYYWEYNNE